MGLEIRKLTIASSIYYCHFRAGGNPGAVLLIVIFITNILQIN